MANIAGVLILGLAAGILSGFLGVGGGVMIVPVLGLMLGFDHKMAVGTSLGALLPPVGILGAWEYYKHGQLNITFALLLGLGLLIGGYIGAIYAVQMSSNLLKKIFALFLLFTSLKMLWDSWI